MFAQIHIAAVCAVEVPMRAIEYVGIATLPNVLFSGFYVTLEDMPDWISWASWCTPVTWVFRLLLEEEFRYCHLPEHAGTPTCIQALAFVESNYATEEYRHIYLLSIFGFVLGMFLFSHYQLAQRSKP